MGGVLALSSWTWLVAAALGFLVVGVLIRVTIVFIVRIKALGRKFSSTSDEVNGALEAMREELDRATEELAELRHRRESDAG
jgi:uncharacterized protein YoxC